MICVELLNWRYVLRKEYVNCCKKRSFNQIYKKGSVFVIFASKMAQLTTSLSLRSWLERPTGTWEAMGSIPVGDSEFFFVPRSCHAEHLIFIYCACYCYQLPAPLRAGPGKTC